MGNNEWKEDSKRCLFSNGTWKYEDEGMIEWKNVRGRES